MKKFLGTLLIFLLSASSALASTQVLIGGYYNSTAAGQTSTTWIGQLNESTAVSITSIVASSTMPFAGVLSSLYVMSPSLITGTQSYAFTVQKNGADTSMTCTINSSSPTNTAGYQYCTDTSDTVSYIATDGLVMKEVPANTPPQSANTWSTISTPTNPNDTWIGGTSVTVNNSATAQGYRTPQIDSLQGNNGSTGTTSVMFFPEAGTLDKLYVTINGNPSPGSFFNTIMAGPQFVSKNALSTTTITCNEVSGVSALCNDLVHSVSVSQADMWNFSHVPDSAPTARLESYSLRYVPTVAGNFDFFYSSAANSIAPGLTRYVNVMGGMAPSATEASSTAIVNDMTFTKVYGHFPKVPGGSETRTITLRVNKASTALSCVESSASTECVASGAAVIAHAGDIVDWQVVTSAAAADLSGVYISASAMPTPPPIIIKGKFQQTGGKVRIVGGKIRIQ